MLIPILLSMLLLATLAEDIPYEIFSWKQIEFEWPCPEARETAIRWGKYIPQNNAICYMAKWKDNLFINIPRFKKGVASTLNYIDLSKPHERSPKLCPYPSWEANTLPNPGDEVEDTQIITAEAVQVDNCNRLWVLDWGYEGLEPWQKRTTFTDPSIVIFDLENDNFVRRYSLKKCLGVQDDSRFNNMVLDLTSSGDILAYIADIIGCGLIVYSFNKNDAWRIEHNFFYPDPFCGYVDYGDLKFAIATGLYGIALTDIQKDGYRTAFFHALGSTKEFKVSTEVLLNATYANSVEAYHEFQLVGERGPKTSSHDSEMDHKTGIVYFAVATKYGVSCWNTAQELNPSNFKTVLNCGDRVIIPYNVMFDEKDNLWILSSNLPQMVIDKICPYEVNYRILKMSPEEARKPCEICS